MFWTFKWRELSPQEPSYFVLGFSLQKTRHVLETLFPKESLLWRQAVWSLQEKGCFTPASGLTTERYLQIHKTNRESNARSGKGKKSPSYWMSIRGKQFSRTRNNHRILCIVTIIRMYCTLLFAWFFIVLLLIFKTHLSIYLCISSQVWSLCRYPSFPGTLWRWHW